MKRSLSEMKRENPKEPFILTDVGPEGGKVDVEFIEPKRLHWKKLAELGNLNPVDQISTLVCDADQLKALEADPEMDGEALEWVMNEYQTHFGLGVPGIQRLDWFLSRYWDEAEADLAFRGISLLSLFQDCRVRYLLNLLDHLPRNTSYKEAMSQDEELAEMFMRNRTEEPDSSRIRVSEFSPEVEAIYGAIDRLGDVVAGLVGLGGGKPPRIAPVPRPVTAIQRVEKKLDLERHQKLVKRLLPNG